MLSLNDFVNEVTNKKQFVAQQEPTFIAQGYLTPASTSSESHQDSSISDCGDFVDSEDEYDVEEKAGPLERYAFGRVYCPIRIGQLLVQTYRIEHKLGHGGFSTVWMAHDIKKNRDVALKIMVSGEDAEYKLSMQN